MIGPWSYYVQGDRLMRTRAVGEFQQIETSPQNARYRGVRCDNSSVSITYANDTIYVVPSERSVP